MTITNQSTFVAAMASAEPVLITKASVAAKAAGSYQSLWKVAGSGGTGVASATAAPTGENPTKATLGSLPYTNGGAQMHNVGMDLCAATQGTFCVYDRLYHASGLVGNVTSDQSVTASLTRETSGVGVEAWLEIDTPTGATPSTVTLTYVGTSGNTLTATASVVATPVAGQGFKFNCAEGVLSTTKIAFAPSTGTAGAVSLVLRKCVGILGCTAGAVSTKGPFDLRMPRIATNACLELVCVTSTTSTGAVSGSMSIGNG